MIEWLTFTSPKALVGYPMGDSPTRSFPVFLPPGYHDSPNQLYPVVFFLAGYAGKSASLVADHSAFEKSLPQRWTENILDGTTRPFVGVFPDCSSKLGGSQFINSPAFGHYMDYLCDELVPFIESKYRVAKVPEQRVVVGHSSGGFGALVTGMLRPDKFKVVCSSAGDSFFAASMLPHVRTAVMELERAGGVANFIRDFLNLPTLANVGSAKFETMLTLAMAPCFAPNLEAAPLFGDLFFDLYDGRIIEEIWQKYLAWDPVNMADRYVDNLRNLDFVLMECGTSDEYGLHLGHRQLARKLKNYQVAYEIVEYSGRHGGQSWRYAERMTRILQRLS